MQALLRIDTTNPPGNESVAAEYLAEVLRHDGLDPILVGPEAARRSLVVRLGAQASTAPRRGPLLLHAHLDVVPADGSRWTHPPFAGEIHDGWLWGRGAVDMKHMAVMSALVMARLVRERRPLQRDLIFAAVADEEAGSDAGARYLVEQHPDLVRAEYALGEVGGATLYIGDQALYPIQVAEKGVAWLHLTARGTPGHGSLPRSDNAIVRLGDALRRLGQTPLPHHLTPVVARYLDAVAKTQPYARALILRQLKNPRLARALLRLLPDPSTARALGAALANTVSPTMLDAGTRPNVIPAAARAVVDARTLPGQSTIDLIAEIRAIIGPDIDITVERDMPPLETDIESPLYSAICDVLRTHHPGAVPIPYLMPGFTDAKQWARLGARCYGFTPIRFPAGVRFADLFHGDDERIPIDGLRWGLDVLYDLVVRFCT